MWVALFLSTLGCAARAASRVISRAEHVSYRGAALTFLTQTQPNHEGLNMNEHDEPLSLRHYKSHPRIRHVGGASLSTLCQRRFARTARFLRACILHTREAA